MNHDDAVRAAKMEKWLEQLKEINPVRRLAAAGKLCRLGKHAVAAVPALVECLKDPSVHMRKMAALGLGEIGEPIDLVVPALYDALSDTEASVRRRAAVALTEVLGESLTALMMVQARLSVAPPETRERLMALLGLPGGSEAAA